MTLFMEYFKENKFMEFPKSNLKEIIIKYNQLIAVMVKMIILTNGLQKMLNLQMIKLKINYKENKQINSKLLILYQNYYRDQ